MPLYNYVAIVAVKLKLHSMNLEVTSLSINKIGVKPRSHFGKAIKQDIMGQRHKI